MSRKSHQENAVEATKPERDGFELPNKFLHALLEPRIALSLDDRRVFVSRIQSLLKRLSPELTTRSRPLHARMTTLVQEIENATLRKGLWHPPLIQRSFKKIKRVEIEMFMAKRDEVVTLLQEICSLHRMEPALAAQEAQFEYRQAQSARASQPRKLDEQQRERIAKRYWDAKAEHEAYGIVKTLAAQYGVSPTTIQTVVKKYKPN